MHLSPEMWGANQVDDVHAMGPRAVGDRLVMRTLGWTKSNKVVVAALLLAAGVSTLAVSPLVEQAFMMVDRTAPAQVVSTRFVPAHTTAHYNAMGPSMMRSVPQIRQVPETYFASVWIQGLEGAHQLEIDRSSYGMLTRGIEAGQDIRYMMAFEEGPWSGRVFNLHPVEPVASDDTRPRRRSPR